MHFRTLYFDLDDTLYPASSGLWEAIRQRMNQYMQKVIDLPLPEIAELRHRYLEQYGTTLRGLQAHYDIDADEYLEYVHDLPLENYIKPDPALRTLILSLPERRWIFTNSDARHAERVLNIIGLNGCFLGIIDIRALDFICKPDRLAYKKALTLTAETDSSRCVIFDDSLRNLIPAREIGFHTILVGNNGTETAVDRTISSLHELSDAMPELWQTTG